MTDRLGEALEWWDEDNPDKPWYMDPAKELWERRGKQDEWGRITTDAIFILLHVRERLVPMEAAARAWHTLTNPTDEMIERVARLIGGERSVVDAVNDDPGPEARRKAQAVVDALTVTPTPEENPPQDFVND